MLAAAVMATVLVALTIACHYEALRLTSALLPRLGFIGPRGRVVVVVFACFAAHTAEVWLYAFGYHFLHGVAGLGTFGGAFGGSLADAVYFSVVTYTSLGFGDVYPLGGTRLVAGVEALNGLVLIAWSASFTYLAMEKFWPLHGGPRR